MLLISKNDSQYFTWTMTPDRDDNIYLATKNELLFWYF